MSDDIHGRALAELTEFEAASFQFGQRVRAFLAGFPQNLPEPITVLPRFTNSTLANGDMVFGGASYVHLVVKSAAEVEAWSVLLQAPVTQKVTKSTDYTNLSSRAEGVIDGLRLYVGASETYSPEQWQQFQEDGAEPIPGGAE